MPQVVAHRGASDVEAEHTLAAYERAIADGADALECDVRLTRDGVLVCVHDRRVDRTSTGAGPVSTLELAELAELDFASWRASEQAGGVDGEAPDRATRGGVLTLERLLETVSDAGRPIDLAIETKHPTRYSGLVEVTLVTLLERFGLTGAESQPAVRVMSFSAMGLRRLQLLAPAVPTVYLMRRVPVHYRDGRLPRGVPIAGPALPVLRRHPRYVERAHAAGHAVHVWTVNDPADVDFVVGLGVDAVITDRPADVRRHLLATAAAATSPPEE